MREFVRCDNLLIAVNVCEKRASTCLDFNLQFFMWSESAVFVFQNIHLPVFLFQITVSLQSYTAGVFTGGLQDEYPVDFPLGYRSWIVLSDRK